MTSEAPVSGWRTVSVQDVATVNPETIRGLDKAHRIRYIDISSVDSSYRIADDLPEMTLDEAPSRAKRLVREGDVLFSTVRSERRSFAVVPSKYDRQVASTGFAVIRPAPDSVEPGFLWAAVRSPDFVTHIVSRQKGNNYPAVSAGDVAAAPLVLPPIDEQRRIAWVVGSLDDKIENNRRLARTIEQITVALFKARFVDFVGHQELVDSEIGRIPKGWRVAPLEELLAAIEVGVRPRGGVSKYASGVPSIGAESIAGLGRFDYSKTKFIPPEFFATMKRGRFENRDVLLYKDGGRPGEFEPHVTLFGDGFPFDEFAINEHVYRLRARKELGQAWLYFSLSSDRTMEEMRIKGTGVAIPGLNSTQVRSLTTLVPPAPEVEAFNAVAEPLLEHLLCLCRQSRLLSVLRDALLPRLISGQIRVPASSEVA